ncbi:MAG: hypothetical protein ABI696_01690 [Rubrivivax sp.]
MHLHASRACRDHNSGSVVRRQEELFTELLVATLVAWNGMFDGAARRFPIVQGFAQPPPLLS